MSPDSVTSETLVDIYRTAATITAVDEQMRSLLGRGRVSLFYYSPRGQEIIPSAMSAALQPGDYVLTTYRGLHDQIASGTDLKELLAENFGRVDGRCRGKGGNMHITDTSCGLMVTTGIVGGGLPIANGLGLASQLKNDGRVTVVNFGEGATTTGAFHEAVNLAAIWKLPVIFVCQNNLYGEFSPLSETQNIDKISLRAEGYGMKGVTVDGNDAKAMFTAAREAIDRARSGEGPTLLECVTYRFMGHYFGDQMVYMDPAELQAAIDADPVVRLRAQLLEEGHATEEQLAEIDQKAAQDAQEAADYGLASPSPDPSELFDHVYAEVA